jgi:glyoxylase-like metal-dependent hydrolase (beta-lactamase superfamily II)
MSAPVFANSSLVGAPERLMLRGGAWRKLPLWVRYGLFLSETAGPVLIDTGYTSHALSDPGRSAALRLYGRVLAARLLPEGQPEAFLARFGLRLQDITTVVVTHFHADHVSGLALFPRARFLASAQGWEGLRKRSAMGNLRHAVFPELLPADFAGRVEFIEAKAKLAAGFDLLGDGALIGVPLPGHAEGHFGLMFPQLERPLLYAVDVQWLRAALPETRRPGFPAMLVAEDRGAHARSCDWVQDFAKAGGDVVLCHDPVPGRYDLTSAGAK